MNKLFKNIDFTCSTNTIGIYRQVLLLESNSNNLKLKIIYNINVSDDLQLINHQKLK